jgi:hypothetical protein
MRECKLNGAWEKRDKKFICRYLIAWSDISNSEKVGFVTGYCGGGTFLCEKFYAFFENDQVKQLWIDYTDRISGYEIDFQTVEEQFLDKIASIESEIWEWNNEDEWFDEDQLVLLAKRKKDLQESEDLLLLNQDKASFLQIICEKAGLTASPSK